MLVNQISPSVNNSAAAGAIEQPKKVSDAEATIKQQQLKDLLNKLEESDNNIDAIIKAFKEDPSLAKLVADKNTKIGHTETDKSYVLNIGDFSFDLPKDIMASIGITSKQDLQDAVTQLVNEGLPPELAMISLLKQPIKPMLSSSGAPMNNDSAPGSNSSNSNNNNHVILGRSSGSSVNVNGASSSNGADTHVFTLSEIWVKIVCAIEDLLRSLGAKSDTLKTNNDTASVSERMQKAAQDLYTDLKSLSVDNDKEGIVPSLSEAYEAAMVIKQNGGKLPPAKDADLYKKNKYLSKIIQDQKTGQLESLSKIPGDLDNISVNFSTSDLDGTGIVANEDGTFTMGNFTANSLQDLFKGNVTIKKDKDAKDSDPAKTLGDADTRWDFSQKLAQASMNGLVGFQKVNLNLIDSNSRISLDPKTKWGDKDHTDPGVKISELTSIFKNGNWDEVKSTLQTQSQRDTATITGLNGSLGQCNSTLKSVIDLFRDLRL